MASTFKHYAVFISSPGDVATERQVCLDTVGRITANIAEPLRITLSTVAWERDVPRTPDLGTMQIQDDINAQLRKIDIFVLILGERYGSIERGHEKSNTEREVDTILERKRADPGVTVLCYLKEPRNLSVPDEQQRANRAFRERLQSAGVRSKNYIDHTDFEKSFTHDLYTLCIRLRNATFKMECLSRFWVAPDAADNSEKVSIPDLALIYLPVLRVFEDQSQDTAFWYKRLMPNVSFEDTKAIQKIQKMCRMLGLSSKVYMANSLPHDARLMNRVWVGAPRIRQALAAASKARALFEFKRDADGTHLRWTFGRTVTTIRSPLRAYLASQRNAPDVSGEWNSTLGRVCAKDFAVLARIPQSEHAANEGGQTFDYFVAGIRGLGTWGAAWYLDRKYRELREIDPRARLERLLEVTYRDGSIADVVDITDKGPEYVRSQCREATISQEIRSHKSVS